MKEVIQKVKLVFAFLLVLSFSGCDDDDDTNLPQVVAGFTFTQNEDTGTVTFINVSEEANSYEWDFGNGDTSTEVNPIVTFANGTYNVKLEALNVAGASAIFEDEIIVQVETPDPGFDSGLLTNGDFENGTEPWIGGGLNVETEGGNSFNSVNVEVAGNPFDVNLSQVVEITQGTNYILSFEASSDRERTIIAGIGLNEAPFTNTAPVVNLSTDTQTITLQLSASDFGGTNSRVLFDMGAEVGTVVIDKVSLVEGGDGSDSNGGGGFDDGLLTNGDFEGGDDPWIGSGRNIVTDGGNSFNSVDVMVAGNAFDVNLSQVVEIVQGTNYILSFEASSDRARTILAGIGLNVDPFTNTAPSVNLTTDTQTFTLQLSAADFGGANSRVLFDMGAEVGVVVIDNVSLVEGGDGSDSGGGSGGTFDDGLLTNGDFESGDDPWIGGGRNIVSEGGNSFNSVDVMVAGNAFDVNLSQVVEITQDANYILTFEASSDRSRTMIAGIGLNVDPFTSVNETVDLTTDTQTFTLNLNATGFGGADSRVLFDMGAEVGTVIIDKVSLVLDTSGSSGGGCTDTEVAATMLPLDFEGCETFLSSQNFGAGLTSELTVNPSQTGINTSDFVLRVDKPTGSEFFAGIQNVFPSNFDLTTTDTFKVKVYSTKANVVFRFELLANPNDGSIGNPAAVFATIPNANAWTEVEFTFINLPASPTSYSQLVIKPDNDEMDSPITEGGTYYLDDLILE
ncbi:PKD domain-containing protein [Ulvibacterium sp.]|uniref:PKD domain-containing protein n=1 Tax=Ulvibacterium sp. TaxID=2665914 RepID=UPI003BA89957